MMVYDDGTNILAINIVVTGTTIASLASGGAFQDTIANIGTFDSLSSSLIGINSTEALLFINSTVTDCLNVLNIGKASTGATVVLTRLAGTAMQLTYPSSSLSGHAAYLGNNKIGVLSKNVVEDNGNFRVFEYGQGGLTQIYNKNIPGISSMQGGALCALDRDWETL